MTPDEATERQLELLEPITNPRLAAVAEEIRSEIAARRAAQVQQVRDPYGRDFKE